MHMPQTQNKIQKLSQIEYLWENVAINSKYLVENEKNFDSTCHFLSIVNFQLRVIFLAERGHW